MSVFYIHGGNPLEGETTVQGAKNSVLPLLAACLLARGTVTLRNCPRLTDVTAALDILNSLGCRTWQQGDVITVDPSGLTGCAVSEERMRTMRSSIMFLGPLLARMGEARMTCPGGCELGPRPIDLHLSAIRALGCSVEEAEGGILCRGRPVGGDVRLSFPSVGATENAMLCAVGGSGVTVIHNAAREPEIVELQRFLNALGGRVTGAGGSVVTVEGGHSLTGGDYTVMGDRIVAATLLSAAAAAGGKILLKGVDWRHLSTVLSLLRQAGCRVESGEDTVLLERDRSRRLRAVPSVRTAPYPGFPTDAQPPVMAALAASEGCTLFVETVFDRRYRHVPQLIRMGADIRLEGRAALVYGVERLHGAFVEAEDLRGGGALTAAALGAEGTTVLSGLHHIDRGYEALETVLSRLGGRIERRDT